MTLRLVKDGEVEVDPEDVAAREAAKAAIDTGANFVLIVGTEEGQAVHYIGPPVNLFAAAEEVCRSAKVSSLGLVRIDE